MVASQAVEAVVDPLAGVEVGHITSGTFSPTLKQAVALAYVPPRLASVGTIVEVLMRGVARKAEVVPYPFVRTGLTKS